MNIQDYKPTATDKALKLVQKFIDNAYQEDKEGLYTPIAKQCALILVDEILELPIVWSSEGSFMAHHNGVESTEEFWQEVKKEISLI